MKRAILATIALLLCLAVNAQETAEDWFWDKPISSIQWEGLKKANRNELEDRKSVV